MVSVNVLLLLALAASVDAAPNRPLPAMGKIWKRYYGDARHLPRPAPLMEKRGSLPSGWVYNGCVNESQHQRLLQGFSFSTRANTPVLCLNECGKRGFTIAGTEYGDECYCGHELVGSGGVSVDESYCDMPCAGDKTSSCGAAWFLSLYTYNTTLAGPICGNENDKRTTISSGPTATTATTPTALVTSDTPVVTSTSLTTAAPISTDAPTPTPTPSPTTSTASEVPTTSSTASEVPTTSSTTSDVPTTSTVNPVPSSIPSSSAEHYVWAHHMVGNTYPYTQDNWAADVSNAQAHGIDGFALNMGAEVWELDRVQSAYRVAEASGNFKLFLSLDMSSLRCGSADDANNLVNIVKAIGSSSAQAKIDNKILVSTFSGQDCSFGTGSNAGWKTQFKDVLAAAGLPVHFVPAFFVDPSSFSSYDWIDGEVNWNSAWPMGDHDITSGETDMTYISSLGSKSYMSTVSPFFFTHFGPNTWNKNWIYRSDEWLYCSRWEQIIAMRDKAAMTEILTWNDYGESSYLGPVSGMLPPTSNLWVDGFDHHGLGALTKYYATAFKTGSYPTITEDSIVMWSRPHPAAANAQSDTVGRPLNWQWTDDNLYAVILAKAPATVVLKSGTTSQTFTVPAGLSKLKMPSSVGGIGGSVQRAGVTTVEYSSGDNFNYNDSPQTYNFNYFVGSASA